MQKDKDNTWRLPRGNKETPEGGVDIVITDPPYGMNYQSGWRTQNKYEKIINDNNLDFIDTYFSECYRLMKDNTAIYCFCSWHNIDVFKQAFEKYFKLKNILVWVKNNHGSGDLQAGYAPQYELILYGNKGRRTFEKRRTSDVLYFKRTGNNFHPTEKPTDLLQFLISNSSKKGDTVFDGFMGSGSTGVACVNTNRNFIGIELDPNYYQIATERIAQAEKSKKELLFDTFDIP